MFCIGHKHIALNLPENAYLIKTSSGFISDDVHQNLINLSEISDELDFYYPWLGGTAGILAIPEILRNKNISYSSTDRIMLFQQAKIVTAKPIGWKSNTYPNMRVMPSWLAHGIDIQKISQTVESSFLLPELVSLPGGDMVMYSRVHHLPDYLRFCAICIDEGVLTAEQAIEMQRQEVLIPGGGFLGICPIKHFMEIVEITKMVGIKFLEKNMPGNKSQYQRIAVGYLIERLASYLLIKRLSKEYGGIPIQFLGSIVAVTNSDYVHGSSCN